MARRHHWHQPATRIAELRTRIGPERKRRPLQLSQLKRDNMRRALRSLLLRYGRAGLAKRMGLTYDALRMSIKRPPTMRVAVPVAFVAGVEVTEVLAGLWPCVCSNCGRRQ